MLDDYLNGQTLLFSAMLENVVYGYNKGSWTQVTAERPRGIAIGSPLVISTANSFKQYRPNGTLGATIHAADVAAHEIVYDKQGTLYISDTKGSRLTTIDSLGNYTELWRVMGVDSSDDDRSHINGIGVKDGVVTYVSLLGISNNPYGWREDAERHNGALVDITTNTVIKDGLFLPHSPRWKDNTLWFCESGNGSVVTLDPATQITETVITLPGFTRGLAFNETHAFVGQSHGRPSAHLLDNDRLMAQPGISVIDLTTNQEVHFEPMDVQEIFDVQLNDYPLTDIQS